MQNNLFFDISFCMHNDLRMIKILSTIYLLLVFLFLSVSLCWHHESLVHKTRKFVHDTEKTGSTSNLYLSMTIRPLRIIFNCINLYTSYLKVFYSMIDLVKANINPQIYYICSSKVCIMKRYISADNDFS